MTVDASEFDPAELTMAEVEAVEQELDAALGDALADPRKRTRTMAAVAAANRRRTDPTATTDSVMTTVTMRELNAAFEAVQERMGTDPTVGANGAGPSPSLAPTT